MPVACERVRRLRAVQGRKRHLDFFHRALPDFTRDNAEAGDLSLQSSNRPKQTGNNSCTGAVSFLRQHLPSRPAMEELAMTEKSSAAANKKLKPSWQIYEESCSRWRPQLDDGRPRQSEDDQQRELFGPRGVPGKPYPAKMVPQRKKKTPTDFDPGHTA